MASSILVPARGSLAGLALLLAAGAASGDGSGQQGPAEEATLLGAGVVSGDQFGTSVDVDAGTLVVGASATMIGGLPGVGAAYVFARRGTVWEEEVRLIAPDWAEGDRFGWSVAVDGDTVLVGARDDDDWGPDSGSAYVFVRSGTAWSFEAKLTGQGTSAGAQLGSAVGLDGDIAAVGAPRDDGLLQLDRGSVRVFARSGTTWSEEAELIYTFSEPNELFGGAVAVDGDRVAVGAIAADFGNLVDDTGIAVVYRRSGTNWSQEQVIPPDIPVAGAQFGSSVALDGERLLVGARADSIAATFAGAAIVYRWTGTNWALEERLTIAEAAAADFFGIDVDLSGDRAYVGAIGYDGADTASGAVIGFTRYGSRWAREVTVLPANGAGADNFGWSLAFDGVILGASSPGADEPQSGAGAVHAFVEPVRPGTALCYGHAPDPGCPCGNPSATAGEGCRHSGGVGMKTFGAGSTSIAADDLALTTTGCPPGNSGIYYSGRTFLDPANPLFDGLQCAGGDVRRYQGLAQQAGTVCDTGFVAQDPSAVYFAPGVTYYFQFWSRDVAGGPSACGHGSNFGPAYAVVMSP